MTDVVLPNVGHCFTRYGTFPHGNVKILFDNLTLSLQNTIKSLLSKTKDKLPKLKQSGTYKLQCGDCEAAYIGRAIRPLNIRINEHLNKTELSGFDHHIVSHLVIIAKFCTNFFPGIFTN